MKVYQFVVEETVQRRLRCTVLAKDEEAARKEALIGNYLEAVELDGVDGEIVEEREIVKGLQKWVPLGADEVLRRM